MLFQVVNWCGAKPPLWLKCRMSVEGYAELTGDDILRLLKDCPIMLCQPRQDDDVPRLYIEEPGHRFTQR
jgi:hypothetical protein